MPLSLDQLVELEYLGLEQSEVADLVHPFELRTETDLAEPHMHLLRLMRNPDYFYFTVKTLCNIELAPFQCVILKEMWVRRFPMLVGSRGLGKSFLLGLYAVLHALFKQGSKVVICGSGFRQAKTVFAYAENIWHNSPMLQSLLAEQKRNVIDHGADRWVLRIGESTITALPVGDGSKIRGERANCIIMDEFASVPREIFETVISGFGVVNLSPIQQARRRARIRVRKRLGQMSQAELDQVRSDAGGNQIILSGTAYYQFNHFCDYWKKWKGIVESKGDAKKLRQVFGDEPEEGLDWRDYSVIRIPYTLLPEGYYDEAQISRSKGTIHSGIFANEFGAVFSSDSNGFFKRSLIETCVTSAPVTPNVPGAGPVQFKAVTRGTPGCSYVIGVDPASERDNFAVVVLEVHGDHRRIVHAWTTDRQRFNAKVRGGQVGQTTYYGFCARKIRELMKTFHRVEVIALDAQGGGQAGVLEALHDPANMEPGEPPIWSLTPDHVLSDGKERESDDRPGLHIVELCNFNDARYIAEANHGLRKDLEDRAVLFPMYDAVMVAEAMVEDQARKRVFDTLEDCVEEIEELKDELTTIVHSQTPGTLRDKWDTPETKIAGSKKGRLRKDRYSALMMANHAARRLARQVEAPELVPYGGFADLMIVPEHKGDLMYSAAPDWFTKGTEGDHEAYGWA